MCCIKEETPLCLAESGRWKMHRNYQLEWLCLSSWAPPPHGYQTGYHWGRGWGVPESGCQSRRQRWQWSREALTLNGEKSEVEPGGAPADDVTDQPAFEPRRAFQGVESPEHHGCLPGWGSWLRECCSLPLVPFFLPVPYFLSAPVSSTLPLCLPDLAGRPQARGDGEAFRPAPLTGSAITFIPLWLWRRLWTINTPLSTL